MMAKETSLNFLYWKKMIKKIKDHRTTIVFSLKNKVGVLCEVLESFKKYKINLTRIVSRPYKNEWEYIFFIEVTGIETDVNLKNALKNIKNHVIDIYVLGSYPLKQI